MIEMVWFVYINIALYALLTIIASVSQVITTAFHVNHFLFIVVSVMMFSLLFIHN
ncbi:hypothetical protein CV093_00855 [Oceanobacillus sp. 143]|uniref:hypothetical protein n=1 Tax=Oceanobacillus zhaokaii TaxID=2052660 RepID=UPI0013185C09|nr:hypothetical protein [Oceanobacillus zhaokaii]QGS67819.1 hypothetical protein CV093_00855 [Oceanobacillus sp. 143]